MIEKKCTKCKEVKKTSEFYKRGNGFVSSCKSCQTIRHRDYARRNPDKVNRIALKWYYKQKTKDIDYDSYIMASLSYDHNTGLLRWRKSHGSIESGDVAGTPQGDGRIFVGVLDKVMRAHRVAWFLHYGEWPNGDIDHINRDPSDNRIANLRIATRKQNARNKGIPRNNTSGIKGASFHTKKGMWRAVAQLNGKHYHLGYFSTPEEAGEVYEKFCSEHHKEFYYGGP